MALDLTPLESLPPAVEKVAGPKAPAPLKMMAAGGLSPLKPGELAVALYQLAVVEDGANTAVKERAQKTAAELPEKILKGALAEPLDARVIDFFARRVFQKPPLVEVVLLNRATADETYCHLATLCNEAELELIARNEERLLRHPPIIAALYMNPRTRMSTSQRALELAVRNHVHVDGIPAFEEAQRAIIESLEPDSSADDDAFKRAAEVAIEQAAGLQLAAVDETEQEALQAEEAARADALASGELPPDATQEEVDEKKQRLEELSPAAQIRVATLGNAFARAVLIRSRNKQVAMACIKSPGVSDAEAQHYAANRSLDDSIIRFIARKKQWVRLYSVKVALANNPKTPIPQAMSFLPHLRPPELKAIARSKGVPSAVANAAKAMLRSRGGD